MMFKQKNLISVLGKAVIALPLLAAIAWIGTDSFPQPASQILTAIIPVSSSSHHYQLVEGSISDGESLQATDGRKKVNVKLCGISTSELGESKAADAQTHLQQLAWKGDGQIVLVFADLDSNRQQLAEVFVPTAGEEVHLNTQMLVDGMAYLDLPEASICPNGSRLAVAQDIAKQEAVGVWSQPLAKKAKEFQSGSR